MSAVPTVYFIDDSATMREVIKIAFRRESMNVIASHDASTALNEIENARPDIVITDVIMPEKDGYEVCQFIKTHPELAKIPVILMSGVVNRAVAERAFAVKADELLRKPFQPQDLVARVKSLLRPSVASLPAPAAPQNAAAVLSGIFSNGTNAQRPSVPAARAIVSSPPPNNGTSHASPVTAMAPAQARPANGADPVKLKIEILRLEGLVRKLQSELQAEREYSQALEAHIKTLQEND